MVITIDGPAGTGKTTVAWQVAVALNYVYFETGAMYRAVTYHFLVNKGSLETFNFVVHTVDGKICYYLCDEDVTEQIRSQEITAHVSEVSARPEVRAVMVQKQRALAHHANVVFEGRDMGTVVFPKADVKIYLDASPEVRAQRRYAELCAQKSVTLSQEEVLADIIRRDKYDSSREVAPLRQAEDAHYIDTSHLTIAEVVETIISYLPS